MNEQIKKQKTLFRFVSLRAPEKSKKENQEKRFVFHPDNKSGVYFTAVKNKKSSTTRWAALKETAKKFKAITNEQEIAGINKNFFEISEWLAVNKITATDEEILNKIKKLNQLNGKTELKLWDNLFYQVITQSDFYVKEAIIQMLVLQNLIKYKSDTKQIKNLANAKVVLPKELFELSDFENDTSKKQENKNEKIWDKDLEIAKNIELSKAKADNIKTILNKLKNIEKEHKIKYQNEYVKKLNEYQDKIRPKIEKFNKDYATEYRKLYKQYNDHEQVKIYIDVPQPKIEKFSFTYPALPDIKSLSKSLSKDVYNELINIVDLSKTNSFTTLVNQLEQLLENEHNNIVQNQQLAEEYVILGDTTLPTTTSINPFHYNLCSFKLLNMPGKVGISISISLPNNNYDIDSFLYNIVTKNGNISDGYYEATKNSNIITMSKLFNNNLDFSINNDIEKFTGEILFNNGKKYFFEINPFQLTNCYKGKLLSTQSETENPTDENGTFIPNKFGYRKLGIADYKKVVSEICCYEVGEVAHIENVMAREMREKVTTKFNQRQIIETESTQIETEKISDTTSTSRFEMQSEISKLLQEQRSFNANVNFHAGWGNNYSLDASTGYASNVSKEESNRQAVQQARELTERATERIVSRVNNEKTTKTTEEFTVENSHRFDNTKGDEHVSGVFRFVDAIYKNQIYNYGKRLMYEFMIPQPSKLHRLAMSIKKQTDKLEKPVDPRTLGYTDFRTINKNNYQILASTYSAEVEKYPIEVITLNKSFSGAKAGNKETFENVTDIHIPENYQAKKANLKFACKFDGDFSQKHFVGISFGNIRLTANEKRFSFKENTLTGYAPVYYLDNLSEKLSISYTIFNYTNFNFSITIHCELNSDAIIQWQKETYEAIIKGYEEQLRIYNEKLEQIKSNGIQILDSNPKFYRQIEQNVLRENCISYLLDNTNPNTYKQFGLKMYNDNPLFTDYKITQNQKMDNYASFVKFMEQAFEWDLMSYHFYPYYWGNKEDWDELYQFDSNDALFKSFMEAGMARVIVTVKPGFEDAVMFYMSTGQIWNGGQVPVIGDPLYLSIVDELAEQEYTVEETWNTVLPTNLIALQKSGVAVDAEGIPCNNDCKEFASKTLVKNDSDLGNNTTN